MGTRYQFSFIQHLLRKHKGYDICFCKVRTQQTAKHDGINFIFHSNKKQQLEVHVKREKHQL